jgi:hypothetical protein
MAGGHPVPTFWIEKDGEFLIVNTSEVPEWEEKGWKGVREHRPSGEQAAQAPPPPPQSDRPDRPAQDAPRQTFAPAPEVPDVTETPSLEKCSIGQLRAIAKDLGLSGHASMKRADALEILGACEADALKALQSLMTNGS